MKKILIVEDNEKHIQDATEVLGKVAVAKSFKEFKRSFEEERPNYVLSDLYFPTGYKGKTHKSLEDESVKIVEGYVGRQETNPVGVALELIFKAKKIKTFEEFLEMFKDDPIIQADGYKNQIRERYELHRKIRSYAQLAEDIGKGVHELPSGIFVYKHCRDLNVPCTIVTSSYHHGTEFQPFVDQVGRYFDQITDGKKQWKQALEEIIKHGDTQK